MAPSATVVQVKISTSEVEWEILKEYLQLEFPGMLVTDFKEASVGYPTKTAPHTVRTDKISPRSNPSWIVGTMLSCYPANSAKMKLRLPRARRVRMVRFKASHSHRVN